MKGAVLTFIGLFVLGCIVGIVQVFAILHIRSKRTAKQSGKLDFKATEEICKEKLPLSIGRTIISKCFRCPRNSWYCGFGITLQVMRYIRMQEL